MGTEKRKAAGGVETVAAYEILQTHYISLYECPKFQTCNAPVCPLDDDWRKRSNLKEDSTCFYLIESVKHGAETHFQGAGLGQLLTVIVRARSDITATHKRIATKLEAARLTGSRMARKIGGN